MRPPVFRATFDSSEMVVDSFAGGGGASTGIEAALGRSPDIAINHSRAAIAMHQANHPATRHFIENIWAVDPREACGSRPVGVAWFSPDCTHHSRARGGKPREQGIRGLAWVVIRWAHDVRPRVIVVENVEEFEGWGPLLPSGQPDPKRVGSTFRMWLGRLRGLGYQVEFRSLVAADYGTPTTRRRLFLIARCDGAPIVWPEATHGDGRGAPWRPAAEVIDWSLPCPSIFERRRPLAEATQRRIAEGIRRYVVECVQPFVIPVKSWGGGGNGPRSLDLPMRTVTASKRGEFAIVEPFVAPVTHQGDARVHGLDEPLRTVTAAHRGELALFSPTLIQTGYGERPGQAPRALDLGRPLGTVVAGGSKHALVAAFLSRHFTGVAGRELGRPVPTVTARDHHSLTAAWLLKYYGESRAGAPVDEPLPTVTSGGGRGGGHLAEVRAFLVKFYKSGGQWQGCDDPLHTITARARFGLVMVAGEPYQIVDIGMRMLAPAELFAAQGFPADYEIAPEFEGKPLTKTDQIALAGNSVCPQVAAAVVAANTRRAP